MNKATFWLVWSVGCVPVLLAALMYLTGWFIPESRSHSGQLLSAQHLDGWQLSEAFNQKKDEHHWRLLLTVPGDCTKACAEWWQVLDSIHLSLGKDHDRVILYRIDQEGLQDREVLLNRLGAAVWVADPLGNLVLRYRLDEAPEHILKDLRKLLKVSQVG